MSLKYETVSLGEHLYIKGRIGWKGLKKDEYLDYGNYRIINATALEEDGINWNDCGYITKERFDESPEIILKEKDILISKDGTIGKLGYVKELHVPSTVASGVFVVRNLNKEYIDTDFLYYYFKSPFFKWFIKSVTEGSVIPHLYQRDFIDMEFNLFDLKVQKKCSTILNVIEEKININKRINKNLEDTILKIFDSWFVKFELSNEFSDSKLGLIPKGWKIDYLGSKKSCSIIRSGIDEFDNSKIYVATADVDNSIITSNDTLITMNDKPSRANMQPIAKSIWFAKMIDSRKLIMIDDYCSDLLNNYIFSTGFCGLKCVDKYFYYLWAFLLTDAFDVMKNNFCTGTTMQAINNKDTKLIEFVLPDDNIINQFNVIAKPMFKKIYYNSLEIKKLQKLRDTLLPKLMSGEIDVSKINCDLKIIIRKIYIKSSKLFLWRYLSENQNHIKNTKSNETLLKSRAIHKINKFLAKFNARYRYYRQ